MASASGAQGVDRPSYVDNTTFAGPLAVSLDVNVELYVKASNSDGAAMELVHDWDVPMVSALVLRTHYVLCSGVGTTLNYRIEPM